MRSPRSCRSTGVEVLRIEPQAIADALGRHLKSWLAAGPVQGVYWLPALDDEGPISEMDLATWREALRVRVKSLYVTMQALVRADREAPGTFLVSATRLGGQHGYDESGAVRAAGWCRRRLHQDVQAGAPGRPGQSASISSLDRDRRQGCRRIHRRKLCAIREQSRSATRTGCAGRSDCRNSPRPTASPVWRSTKNTVFLITGAAGSIVSAITADLAAASGGTFYLLDLVPEPDPNNPDLKRFVSDKDGLKRDLVRAHPGSAASGPRRRWSKRNWRRWNGRKRRRAPLMRCEPQAARRTTSASNLTDADAVAAVIDQVRERSGRIDVLLHAAGIERSHFLPDKTPASSTWSSTSRATAGSTCCMPSATCRWARRWHSARLPDASATPGRRTTAPPTTCCARSRRASAPRGPQTRGIVIDWTAWGGIGMATRGSIPKMMELAGIDMLPPEAGVPLIRRELTAAATCGEVVVGQRLGILLQRMGRDRRARRTSLGLRRSACRRTGPWSARSRGMGIYSGLTMETTLDSSRPAVPVRSSDRRHARAARRHGHRGICRSSRCACIPDWHVEAVEEVNFLAPFKFYRDEPRTLTIEACTIRWATHWSPIAG